MRKRSTARNRTTRTERARLWQGHMDGWQQGGLSQRDYCRVHGLSLSTFQLWRRRLQAGATCTALEIVPVPVPPSVIRPAVAPSVESPIAVVIGGGRYNVKVRAGFSSGAFEEILNVLEAR